MNSTRHLLLIVAALTLAIASIQAAENETAGSHPALLKIGGGTLVTTFGIYKIGNCTVNADEARRRIEVTRTTGEKPEVSSAGSAPEEELMEGWFAFVEGNGKHVWMYDGDDTLLLMEWSEKEFGSTYLNPRRLNKNFRVPVPAVVLERLEN